MIGCTLKWSLLNFKQDNSVLAAKAVAARCVGALRSARCEECTSLPVCMTVCVRVCSSTKPDAIVGRPEFTASQSRAGGGGRS